MTEEKCIHCGSLKINKEELPQELIKELVFKKNWTTTKIYKLLKDGPLDINNILIGLYKEYGTIVSRAKLIHLLTTLKYQGKLYSNKGKRGFYSLAPINDEDTK